MDADATGDQPIRRVFGGSALVGDPIGVFVDSTNNEIYAVDQASASITVYALSARNDAAPLRVLTGPATPIAVFVDTTHNELFVTGGDSNASYVQVFDRTASGVATPKRTLDLQGLVPSGIYVDVPNNDLYVSGVGGAVLYARTDSGTATGNYLVPASSPSFSGIAVTGTNVFLSTSDNPAEIDVYLRSDFLLATTPAPQRQITGLTPIAGLALDSLSSEVVVAEGTAHKIVAFPQTWTTAPTGRTITLPTTDTPSSVWVDAANSNLWFAAEQPTASPAGYLGVMAHDASTYGNAAIKASTSPWPVGLAVDSTTSNLWVASYNFRAPASSFAGTWSLFAPSGTTSFASQIAATAAGIAINTTNGELYLSNGSGTVNVYSTAGTLLTSFSASQPGPLWYDGGELFVQQSGDHSVSVYTRSSGGTFTFNRALSGANTGFSNASALYADGTELLVGASGAVLVFPRSASGNVAPSRTINTPQAQSTVGGVLKDATGRYFLGVRPVSGQRPEIDVYPSGAGSTTSPERTVRAIGAMVTVSGLAFCN